MNCPNCGAPVQANARFCPECGFPQPQVAPPAEPPQDAQDAQPVIVSTEQGGATPPPKPALRGQEELLPLELRETRAPESPVAESPAQQTVAPYNSAVPGRAEERPASRIPVLVVAFIALVVILGTLIAVALSIASDKRLPGPAASAVPTVADPAALLTQSADAMSNVGTLHYQSEAGFYGLQTPGPGVTGTGAISMTITGDVKLPDAYTMDTDVPEVGRFVVIGDKTWAMKQGDSTWTQSSTAGAGLGPVNPLAVTSYMRYYKQGTPDEIGTEQRNGVGVHHIRFNVDAARMAAEAAPSAVQGLLSNSTVMADAWVRDNDHLLDSLSLIVNIPDGTGVIIRSSFSRYNDTSINVQPPDTAVP